MKVRFRPALLLAAALLLARPVEARLFDPETFTLDNGLTVVVVPNHRMPVVSHMVWYKVGAADEDPGKSGLAHLLEHLMFKGTPSVPPGMFSKIIARNGGRDNAFTTSDYTGYFQNVAADRLELVMRMEADRMANLTLDRETVETERAVVLEEWRMRVGNSPEGRLSQQMEAALFLNSPYHRPVIGWQSEIARLDRDDALAFYRRWYAPNNAVLVVAGDVDAATVRPLAEKYYGALPRRDLPPRPRLDEPPPEAARRVVLSDPRVTQPSWRRLYLAPSERAGETRLTQSLEVLAEVIGGGATSLLYQSLVINQKLAAGVSASYDPVAAGLTSFRVSATPRPGVTPDQLEAAIDREIGRIARGEIPAEEIERAKTSLRASVAYARDSLHTGAQVLGEALAVGLSVADVESWPERIGMVTPALVAEAAAQVLDPRGSVTGLLLPAEGARSPAGPAAAVPAGPASERGIQ